MFELANEPFTAHRVSTITRSRARAAVAGLLLLANLCSAQNGPTSADQAANPPAARPAAPADTSIRPFHVHVPHGALIDLRHRRAATRWPDQETVPDQSQGIQLAKLQQLVQHWGSDYDWRKAEAKLNALPQFVTTIDGVNIHFIHVRSKHPGALPVI